MSFLGEKKAKYLIRKYPSNKNYNLNQLRIDDSTSLFFFKRIVSKKKKT